MRKELSITLSKDSNFKICELLWMVNVLLEKWQFESSNLYDLKKIIKQLISELASQRIVFKNVKLMQP
jgi:hypothetical protein